MANKDFSKKLKNLRLKAGYSQKDVYEHFGIPQSTFSSWEVGKSEPPGDMLIKLCEFYKCDMIKELSTDENNNVTYAEWNIIEKYRDLDPHGKKMVDFTLNEEWNRSTELAKKESKIIPIATIEDTPEHLKVIAAHNDTEITDEELEKMERDIEMIKKLKQQR